MSFCDNMESPLKEFFTTCLAIDKCILWGISFTLLPSGGVLMYQDGVACKNSYIFSDIFIIPSGKYVVQSHYKAIAKKQVFIRETWSSLVEVFTSLIKLQVGDNTVCTEVYNDLIENVMSDKKYGSIMSQEEILRSYMSTFV